MVFGRREADRLSRSAFEGLYAHKQLVVGRDFVFSLGTVIKVDAGKTAVCVDLHLLALHKLCRKRLLAVLLQIEHDFVPPVVQFQRHRAFEGFDAGDGLVVGRDEGAFDVLIVEDGDFEAEVLVELSGSAATFLTSKTRMGSLMRMEWFLAAGKAR